jgi:hypothetical protein
MSTTFPNTIDQLTNPSATDSVAVVDHAAQHANANDAIEALQAKVGADSSVVTTSHDYKITNTASIDPGHKHTESSLNTSDVTTNNVTSTKHGYAPKSPADATKFLNGAATPDYALVKDSDLSTSDVETNNATSSKHGFLKKLENTGTKFLRDDGTWQTPSSGSSVVTIVPQPNMVLTGASNGTRSGNTTMKLGQVIFPFAITANSISFRVNGHTTTGTIKIALFSEDGQTKLFEVTTASITTTGIVKTSISSVVIAAGIYYLAFLPQSTVNIEFSCFATDADIDQSFYNNVTSEPRIAGSATVSADTIPATITPTTIIGSGDSPDSVIMVCRIDN